MVGLQAGSAHILVVDDHGEIRHLVGQLLEEDGYRVSGARDSEQMYAVLKHGDVDLVLLDVLLPGVDGFSICRDLRNRHETLPIIMLTAKDQELDRVLGLELGADDYITKPFSGRELLARVKALLRRARAAPQQSPVDAPDSRIYRFGRWALDTGSRELVLDDDVIVPLSTSEFKVLVTLVTHPGRTLTRDQLIDLAKGREASPLDRSIDQQVSRLRRKLGDDARNPRIIKTVWGGGYTFTARVTAE